MDETWRVVQLVVTPSPERKVLGSGYLVGRGVVLTAAHILGAAQRREQIEVRFSAWAATPAASRLPALPVLACEHDGDGDSDLGIVVVELPSELPFPNPVPCASLPRADEELPAAAQGFPRWRLRDPEYDRGRLGYRKFTDVRGRLKLITGDAQGRFDFVLDEPPPAASAGGAWSAMSGGPVWVGRQLVGIVGEHHQAEGEGRLVVRALHAVYGISAGYVRESLLERLDLPARDADLVPATGSPVTPGVPAGLQTTPIVLFQLFSRHGGSRLTSLYEFVDCTIGRLESCTVPIRDDQAVSGKHCRLTVTWDRTRRRPILEIRDLSTNGTLVNGELVGPERTRSLGDGDVIEIGARTAFVVRAV